MVGDDFHTKNEFWCMVGNDLKLTDEIFIVAQILAEMHIISK